MERKRTKKLINLGLSTSITKDVTPASDDGLPSYERYIICRDVNGLSAKVWLGAATPEEKKDARKRKGVDAFRNISMNKPIAPSIIEAGFSEFFAQQVARLFIHKWKDAEVSRTIIKTQINTLNVLLDTLSRKHGDKKRLINIDNLAADDFISFRDAVQESPWTTKNKNSRFNMVKLLFAHKAVHNYIQIQNVKFIFKKEDTCKPVHDLTSPLFIDHTYTDSVMFQLLCYFIYYFEMHIGHLREYEELTENDVLNESGGEIIRYGDALKFLMPNRRGGLDQQNLILKWLSDEKYFPIILKHELLWQKSWGLSFYNKFVSYKSGKLNRPSPALIVKYNKWVNERYSIPSSFVTSKSSVFRADVVAIHCRKLLAVKRQGSTATSVKNRTTYCLVNLIMMATGLNREVVLSWESRRDGKSILDVDDNLFKFKKSESSTQALIHGTKNRVGAKLTPSTINTAIPKSSPLYRMLRQYENHLKGDFNGKFFELTTTFKEDWGWRKNGIDLFPLMYPVRQDNGSLLQTLDTRKFRKVFGKAKLFDLMDGVKNPIELAEKIQYAFNHSNLDTTLTHYLLKDKDARSALDLAIVSITEAKLNELSFAGHVDVSGNKKGRKDVFLCECEDPSNPSHEFSIAEECVKYDLCLGCQRSIISAAHLPYICKRILQYEDMRDTTSTWSAFFEDRWMIAHDALKQYAKNDRLNGERLVAEAWVLAKSKKISLPPIIMAEIN